MKIKTIIRNFDWIEEFDQLVNEALAEGWRLVKREVLPSGVSQISNRRLLYAELVRLDPEPAPEAQPLDPVEALRTVQEFCDSNKCESCRLHDFCTRHLAYNEGPADWDLPEEVAT